MYICGDCGARFENYKKTVEAYGEKWYVCPNCESTDITEARRCEYCSCDFFESRIEELCDDCVDELRKKFSRLLHADFTEYEIKALNIIYDGERLE